jgi:hypothetical protein
MHPCCRYIVVGFRAEYENQLAPTKVAQQLQHWIGRGISRYSFRRMKYRMNFFIFLKNKRKSKKNYGARIFLITRLVCELLILEDEAKRLLLTEYRTSQIDFLLKSRHSSARE